MNYEIAETLKLIIDQYAGRTQGSVFIKMTELPGYRTGGAHLTDLQNMGFISKPRKFDNGADITLTSAGRQFFEERHWLLFPAANSELSCPVCGYKAHVVSTDAARSWAEIDCENCSTYAMKADALEDVRDVDLSLLSGYYRHVHHEPVTIQYDDKGSVKAHIEAARDLVTREHQMKLLISYYYQRMNSFGQYVEFENYPALAYATDEVDLARLVDEAEEKGYLKYDNGLISITEKGYQFMSNTKQKPTVFISYNWGRKNIAKELESRLSPYAIVRRDQTSVKPWGDLKAFMNSIRDQDFAVLIISDAYLKSEACLYEVMELMKEQLWDERVMYIVADDAHGIYNTITQLDYIDYWETKDKTLSEAIKKYNPAAVAPQAEELQKIQRILLSISTFMSKIRYTNNPDVEDAIEAVIERVGGKRTTETILIQASDEHKDVITVSGIKVPESLRDGWNFHNDIAIRLEMKARQVFGDRDRPYTKIYDADSIEQGKFAEVMIDVLREKTGRENDREDVDEFIKLCSQFIGKSRYEIDSRISQGLMDKFIELLAE